MIDKEDLLEIDDDYFRILVVASYYVVLLSKCTGHQWHLLEQEANGHRTFLIRHRHNSIDPYHRQTNRPCIGACCRYIMDHDVYHLKKIQKQKEHRLRRLGLIESDNQRMR